MEHGELDAAQRVDDVQVPAGLPALPVDGERVADHRLHAEAVQRGPEDVVVVEPREEPVVERRLLGLDAVDDALVEVRRPQPAHATREVDVVRVVHLRQVVVAARELREGEIVRPPVVVDLEVALFDVDVRRAVLAHRAELHQVTIGGERLDREEHVQRVHHVVRLGEDRVLAVLHGVRRRRHLAVVHDRVRAELLEHGLGHHPVTQVALGDTDLLAGHVLPSGDAFGKAREDRGERVGACLGVGAAAEVVVDDVDLVATVGEPHRGWPPEVAVTAEDQDAHGRAPFEDGESAGIVPVAAWASFGPTTRRRELVAPCRRLRPSGSGRTRPAPRLPCRAARAAPSR